MGLDLGNASVGWVAMGTDYRLKRAKGKELIGARLFNPANTAADRRMHRAMRRRLSRRRWRLRMLDELFAPEITKKDPEFFARRKYSWVHPEDELNHKNWHGGMIFRTKEQDQQFYKDYPTIYHLRQRLMEDTSKHDIREVYLAIHHIIKFRGNFLTEGELNVSKMFEDSEALKLINTIIQDSLGMESDDEIVELKSGEVLSDILNNQSINRSARIENAKNALLIEKIYEKTAKNIINAILTSLVGNKFDLAKLFNLEIEDKDVEKVLKLQFGDAKYEENLQAVLDSGQLSENQIEQLINLQHLYEALVLKRILGDYNDLSSAQIQSYNIHRKNLMDFRKMVLDQGIDKKDFSLAYKQLLSSKEDDNKKGKVVFESMIANIEDESTRAKYQVLLDDNQLFPKQRKSDNGVIPYQLHLNELRAIIKNQGQYYPFLLDTYVHEGLEDNKIEGLLKFRVPYYVGPLVSSGDMNKKDNSENHWMIRKEGKTEAITPWNIDEIVDKDASGQEFINRLTGTDTFLLGEPTLPQHSLLYEEYMVLSELNNVRMSARMGKHYSDKKRRRLGYEEKQFLLNDLFKKRKRISKKSAEECLMRHGFGEVELFGLADEKYFASSLGSYNDLAKVLGNDFVDKLSNQGILEKVIELQTVFEDRGPLKHQLSLLGLSDEQVNKLSNKHYTGWGKLSRKLLETPIIRMKLTSIGELFTTEHSIISVIRAESLSLMELIRKPEYGVGEWIDEQNLGKDESKNPEEKLSDFIDGMAVSPKVKRGVYQAIRVVDDVAKALGNPPQRVFIEMADEVQASHRTVSRKNMLKNLYKSSPLKAEFKEISNGLEKVEDNKLRDDRLFLYYIQLGKDMYTGREIDIDRLQDYDIDHIVPQALTKDDSLDNRVLVSRVENARKSDSELYTPELIKHMYAHWSYLHEHKLMSNKKFSALTRTTPFSDLEAERFVNRSLVDTRQIMKNVSTILRAYYGEKLEVHSINSEITHDMREYMKHEHKNRDINDYHHAQDALCIAAAGQFMVNSGIFEDGKVTDGKGNQYNKFMRDRLAHIRELKAIELTKPKEKRRKISAFSFVVEHMTSPNEVDRVNEKTGEIVWSENDAKYLRHVMKFKKMLITKRVGDVKTHALYNETRYGSELATKKTIPFDKSRTATNLYGGFGSPSTSSMILVYEKGKARLVNITEAERSRIDVEGKKALDEILSAKVKENIQVILDSIMPGQLLKYSDALVTVQSASELNNAIQLWVPPKIYNVIDTILKAPDEKQCLERLCKVLDTNSVDYDFVLREAFEVLITTVDKHYPLMSVVGKKEKLPVDIISVMEFDEQQKILKGFLVGLQANAGRADLGKIGLSASWGRNKNQAGFTLADSDEFIYQSPSGIFETRVSIAELKHRAGIE